MANWDVVTSNSSLEFDTQRCFYNCCVKVDDNHFVNFWQGTEDADGYVQAFTVNTTTWAVTTANSSLEFDTEDYAWGSCCQIDTNHFIKFWQGVGTDGFAQVFTVNTTTWAVTTANSALEFDTQNGLYNSCYKVDTNHFINFWQGVDNDGFVQIFEVNTTNWAVTTSGAVLEFETDNCLFNTCCQIDATHYINFWQGTDADGFSQVFTVNTTTWAVTKEGTALEFDTRDFKRPSRVLPIDSNHFILSWGGNNNYIYAQAFTVSTSTWAVTTAGSVFTVTTQIFNSYQSDIAPIDSTHFLISYASENDNGYIQTLAVNASTYAITTSASALEYDTTMGSYPNLARIDTSHFINFWRGVDSDGFVQTFEVTVPGAGPANLKTLNTNAFANIKTINTNTIANTKTYNTQT